MLDDGTVEGTFGETFLDQRFVAEAREVIAAGASRTLFLEGVRAFAEVVTPPALLLVVGASHVAMPLLALARTLGYRTAVLDGRPRFATRERFPDADDLKIGIPSELITSYPLIPTTALVLVAHDYKYDLPVLKHALGTTVGYIGMLGSARRGAAILNLLREDGAGRGEPGPGAGADRPRPRRPQRAGDRAGDPGRDPGRPGRRPAASR